MLFPEGLVSNGESLLSFKAGAFMLGLPIKVIGLKYSGSFNPSICLMTELSCFLGIMMQPINYLKVLEIDGFIEPIDASVSTEIFAEEIRKLMCNEFELKNTPNNLENCVEFHKKYAKMSEIHFK